MSSTAGHTAGPWHVTEHDNGIIIRVVGETQKPIASMWLNGDDPKANAQLMASSPELLAALEQILRYSDGSTDPGIANMARAAIAKATGAA